MHIPDLKLKETNSPALSLVAPIANRRMKASCWDIRACLCCHILPHNYQGTIVPESSAQPENVISKGY
jgi:hypothetical protein